MTTRRKMNSKNELNFLKHFYSSSDVLLGTVLTLSKSVPIHSRTKSGAYAYALKLLLGRIAVLRT